MNAQVANSQKIVEIKTIKKSISCPMPEQNTWNSHPKVYLAFNQDGQCKCPYCGTSYQLKA